MKRRTVLLTVVAAAAAAGLAAYGLAPVCEPLSGEQTGLMRPRPAERSDRDLYLQVYQQRDGRWFECKTRLSRLFFF
jgi:hypothetical protein